MNENIKAFLIKLEKSPDLQAQFAQIRDPEEAYKLAASVQDGFTKDEFVSEMKKLYEAQVADLSEEDISKVDIVTIVLPATGVADPWRFKI